MAGPGPYNSSLPLDNRAIERQLAWEGGGQEARAPGYLPGQTGNSALEEDAPDEMTESDTETQDEPVAAGNGQRSGTLSGMHNHTHAATTVPRQPLAAVVADVAAGGGGGGTGGGAAGAAEAGSGTDTDEDGKLIQQAQQAMEKTKAAPAKRGGGGNAGKPRAGGGVTLKLLIDEKLIWPGENVLSVEYKNSLTYGSLEPNGRITCMINGSQVTFESPSAFSIYLKRLVNPARKADDGWKTVKFGGKYLEHYKLQLAMRRFSAGDLGSAAAASPSDAPPAKRLKGDADAAKPHSADGGMPRLQAPQKPSAAAGNGAASGTDYARSRPHRQVRPPIWAGSNVEDEHQMVPCEAYAGGTGTGADGPQPFAVEVSRTAELMMDFHAHLNMNEVIGILGGTWDEQNRVIRVHRAFPVRELRTEDDAINVEMDPEDEVAVRQRITDTPGWQPVGWYHSHPQFPTIPSIIDIFNQVTQQFHHRTATAEPYVAAIVGPYDKRLPSSQSSISWFYVERPPGRLPSPGQDPLQAGCTPMALQVDELPDVTADITITSMPDSLMPQLAQRYAGLSTRAELSQVWRGGLTKMDKLRESLVTRLPADWPPKIVQSWLRKLDTAVLSDWDTYGDAKAQEPQMDGGGEEEDEPEISDVTDDDDAQDGVADGVESGFAGQGASRPGSHTAWHLQQQHGVGEELEDGATEDDEELSIASQETA